MQRNLVQFCRGAPALLRRPIAPSSNVVLLAKGFASQQSSPNLRLLPIGLQLNRQCLQNNSRILQQLRPRFQSSDVRINTEDNPHHRPPLPTLTHPIVSNYLFGISALVFAIVVVGGLTRLTESGLSITEWNLVTGVLPPLSEESWQEELRKYLATPEGQLMNKNITMSDFKFIYAMEWGHRILGRVIGLAFLLPIPYFAYKRYLSAATSRHLALIALLIGGQGALGWYMVKSGLTHEALKEANPSGVPRVSQYRLAAHLGMAFTVYALCLREALVIKRDWAMAKLNTGVGGAKTLQDTIRMLNTVTSGRLRVYAAAFTALVLVTAISGAFVAGLDAGLLYNTFPYMGDRIIPPASELYDKAYARSKDQSDRIRRNIFENPTTVQFDHRMLAMTTFTMALLLAFHARRAVVRREIPRRAVRHATEIAGMALIQASLGISTLVYLVPTALASLHQAGSLVLLSLAVAASTSLKRPSYAARVWLQRTGRLPRTLSTKTEGAASPVRGNRPLQMA